MAESQIHPTPEQRRLLWLALTALALTSLAGVAALVFWGFVSFLSWAYPVLLPLGLAIIVALILEPVVNLVQKAGLNRRTSSLLTCLSAMIAFLLFWIFLLPSLLADTGQFLHSLPGLINTGMEKLKTIDLDEADGTVQAATLATNAPGIATNAPPPVVPHVHSTLPRRIIVHSEIQEWLQTNLPLVQQWVQTGAVHLAYAAMGPVSQALGFLLGFGFVPIYVYYFLADQREIEGRWHRYVPLRDSPLRREVVDVLGEINGVLVRYFRGQIVVAACNGLLTSIGLVAIGVPNGLLLGIMTGALSIVPFLGIIASILPALLLAFIYSQTPALFGFVYSMTWVKPLLVLVVFALVQFCESMFITPRVQSHSTGLHPLTIIIGILFWSMLLPGLLGPVVAVPLTCAIVVLMRRYVWRKDVRAA